MKVEVSGLIKKFDDHTALDGVGLKIPEGKITSIIGPSGSGKTTLLRILDLLEKPTSGKIIINGMTLRKRQSLDISRKMGMVFQNPVLFKRSVIANVGYGLKVRKADKSVINKKAMDALERIGLGDRADQFAPSLSSGEGQRMAFARVLVLEPELLFLDEFTANLDPGNVAILEKVVRDYNRDTGCTIVLATHNLYQAKRISDHCVFLLNGKIVEEGTTEKFFSAPKRVRTKRFLSGEMAW